MSNTKWRVQHEWYAPYEYAFEPPILVWAAYPPLRNRKPYLFTSWKDAMRWVHRP